MERSTISLGAREYASSKTFRRRVCSGGYILAGSHTIPPETPDDNIFALYAAAGIGREEIFDRAADLRAAWLQAAYDADRGADGTRTEAS